VIYLYAIIDAVDLPGTLGPGIHGEDVRAKAWGGMACVIGDIASHTVQATEDALWRHEEIVEDILEHRHGQMGVLPVRFGTVLEDEDAARRVLASHREAFARDLAQVRGRVELSLRVLWDEGIPDAEVPPPTTYRQVPGGNGRAYLMALVEHARQMRARRQRAEAVAAELEAPLLQLAADHVHRCLETPRMLLTCAYLIDRGNVEAFQRRVRALQDGRPEFSFHCTGPWPAYSFVSPLDDASRGKDALP